MDFKADLSLTEEEKSFMADWQRRSKLQIASASISAEQAHQVAMVAAQGATQGVEQRADLHSMGEVVAKAYLQAYEAVEDWTKSKDAPLLDSDGVFIPRVVVGSTGKFEVIDHEAQIMLKCTVGPHGCLAWQMFPIPQGAK